MENSVTNLLEKIKSRSSSIKRQRDSFLKKLEELNGKLSESLDGINAWGESGNETLVEIGENDWVYGRLTYSEEGLKIAYRSTEDDLQDAMNNVPDEYRTFHTKNLNSCPVEWLEKLSSEKHITNLLMRIESNLESIEENSIDSFNSLTKVLDSQSEIITRETTAIVKDTGVEELFKIWLAARNSIELDPAESLTRSSSYLESVCFLILSKLSHPVPDTKDITHLIRESVKALNLSPDPTVNKDLTQLVGGVKSIFQAIGSLRTHIGTAHGSTPGDYLADTHHARLVNDAAGTVSTFLLRRLEQKLHKSTLHTAN